MSQNPFLPHKFRYMLCIVVYDIGYLHVVLFSKAILVGHSLWLIWIPLSKDLYET